MRKSELSITIKSFFIHGHISEFLLLATLVPIVKDKLKNLCQSSNYRSIAISSLIMKLLDWIIIILWGENLNLDEFQFGFQEKSSTMLCSWLILEIISNYIQNGSNVYCCFMDCTKAFDTVKHSILFSKMMKAGCPYILIRILIHIYSQQTADVRWKTSFSEEFTMKNGVRQGAVLSPILFCFYVNDLFGILKKNKAGCWMGQYYVGCHGYADDLLLIAPSREGLQDMLRITEKYANENNISFSTDPNPVKSKTNGMIFTPKGDILEPEKLILNGNELPWVTEAKYLGNKFENKINGLKDDI